jgi:galactokinase
MPNDLHDKFREHFGGAARFFRAPGRVNLIGEHTDYNDGFVMPAAIDFSCWVGIGPRADARLAIFSENMKESAEADLASGDLHPLGGWSDYPIGVAAMMERAGYSLRGANLYIWSDVPLGAGLSSSAAIEVAVGYALAQVSGRAIDPVQLALLCQRAENEFVGARCGIMDQFTACHGRAGQAILLDCRSLEYRALYLPANVDLVVCNTMVKHQLAASEYNVRRAECEEAVKRLSAVLPDVRALRDVTAKALEEHRDCLTQTLYQRARHIVTENERVKSAAASLERGDVEALSELMSASHGSLRDDYQVSCAELDAMVEIAARQRGVYGARMTGGGFGGCTINLVDKQHSADFRRVVAEAYYSATGYRPDIYVCHASPGVEEVLSEGQHPK